MLVQGEAHIKTVACRGENVGPLSPCPELFHKASSSSSTGQNCLLSQPVTRPSLELRGEEVSLPRTTQRSQGRVQCWCVCGRGPGGHLQVQIMAGQEGGWSPSKALHPSERGPCPFLFLGARSHSSVLPRATTGSLTPCPRSRHYCFSVCDNRG